MDTSSYLWPLPFRAGISSSFGEFRQTHFHMGIDLKTRGVSGAPVKAVASGHIYRLKVQRRGYGNAVYIRHNDGNTSVYAHLSRFEEIELKLQSIVDKEKKERGYYPGNIYLNIPVQRGQVIGYSGESGVGLPHLHFELRDKNQVAFNPLSSGMVQKDTTSPRLVSLYIEPATARDLVNSKPVPVEIPLHRTKQGIFSFSQAPVITGKCFLKLKTYDTIGAANKCGISSIQAKYDDREFFVCILDKISYTSNNQVGLLLDLGLSGFNPTRYVYKLFREKGLTIPVLKHGSVSEPRMFSDKQPSRSQFEFKVTDSTGNVSNAVVNVIHDSPPAISSIFIASNKESTARKLRFLVTDPDWKNTLQPGASYIMLDYSTDLGFTWTRLKKFVLENKQHLSNNEKGSMTYTGELPLPSSPIRTILYRARVFDGHLYSSYKVFPDPEVPGYIHKQGIISAGSFKFNVHYFRKYLLFELIPGNSFLYPEPKMKLMFQDGDSVNLRCLQVEYNRFLFVYPTEGSRKGKLDLWVYQGDTVIKSRVFTGSEVLTPVTRNSSSSVTRDVYKLFFGENSVYQTVYVYSRTKPAIRSNELPMVGLACEFIPGDIPFRTSPLLTVDIAKLAPSKPIDVDKLGIYMYNSSSGKWKFVDNNLSKDKKTLSAKISKLTIYGVLVDTFNPVITRTYPAPGKRVGGKNLQIYASVSDKGSGIDYRNIKASLDNNPIPMDFDPDRNKVYALEKYNLKYGAHLFRLQVRDIAGNVSLEKTVRFNVY